MDTNTTPVLTDTLDKGVLDMLDEDGATRRLLYMGDVHAAGVFARDKNVLDMPDKGGCNKTLVLH